LFFQEFDNAWPEFSEQIPLAASLFVAKVFSQFHPPVAAVFPFLTKTQLSIRENF
jgi:hypothetical protein